MHDPDYAPTGPWAPVGDPTCGSGSMLRQRYERPVADLHGDRWTEVCHRDVRTLDTGEHEAEQGAFGRPSDSAPVHEAATV